MVDITFSVAKITCSMVKTTFAVSNISSFSVEKVILSVVNIYFCSDKVHFSVADITFWLTKIIFSVVAYITFSLINIILGQISLLAMTLLEWLRSILQWLRSVCMWPRSLFSVAKIILGHFFRGRLKSLFQHVQWPISPFIEDITGYKHSIHPLFLNFYCNITLVAITTTYLVH